ncbi:TPA: hypothetical protein QDC22_007536 [Burkholderia stabilis]|nr:hypothetical protein [Burkholderia stabilis]HDR9589147.1 hypothetical protein [Burkholderia stabilis]HDR9649543.1 hypothetical protein [Burkholderia stabilis]HDR9653609.1 hypothetical protein [Burkholderia stabilis]HDR9656304.1 hypothetical protein [Burkholderia stabilis]
MTRPTLIDNWRQALKLKTIWGAAAITLLSLLQVEVLPLFQFAIPAPLFPWITSVLGTIVIVSRRFELPQGWPMSWRLHSVYLSGVLTGLSLLQAQVMPLFAFAIPANVYPWITAVLGAVLIVGRLIAQPSLDGANP